MSNKYATVKPEPKPVPQVDLTAQQKLDAKAAKQNVITWSRTSAQLRREKALIENKLAWCQYQLEQKEELIRYAEQRLEESTQEYNSFKETDQEEDFINTTLAKAETRRVN